MTGKDIAKIALNLIVIYVIGGLLLVLVYAKTSPIIFKNKKEDKEAALKAMMPVHLKMKVPEGDIAKLKAALPETQSEPESGEAEGVAFLDAEMDIYKASMKKVLKKLRKAGASEIEQYSDYGIKKVGDWSPWHKHAEFFEVMDGENPAGYIVETFGKGYSSYPDIYASIGKDFVVRKIEVLSHGETPGLGDEIMLDWFKNMYKGKVLDQLVVIKGDAGDKIQALTGATISTRAVTHAVRDAVKMLTENYEGQKVEYSWGADSGLSLGGEKAEEESGEEGGEKGDEH
jgi:electron transport complex protein RnfG